MTLGIEDRELFLAEPHVAALSVVARDDRGPLTVPTWYQYVPGGDRWILTPAHSRKVGLIRAAGRFTMLVDRVVPTVRYLSVEGPVIDLVARADRGREDLHVPAFGAGCPPPARGVRPGAERASAVTSC